MIPVQYSLNEVVIYAGMVWVAYGHTILKSDLLPCFLSHCATPIFDICCLLSYDLVPLKAPVVCRNWSLCVWQQGLFFLANLSNSLCLCWCCLMAVGETFWSQRSTGIYNSLARILGESFASRTILLTVREVRTHALPCWFLTSPVSLNFLIIDLTLETHIFHCWEISIAWFVFWMLWIQEHW